MSEFDELAPPLAQQAQADAQKKRIEDMQLLEKVLAVYDRKTVAARLRQLGQYEWTRESLTRWQNGQGQSRLLTDEETAQLRQMLPAPPAHHPNYAFRFIDLFAGIGGI
ncbi:MAG TPA: DNA (cytosine-5-)-methyltransferase, partial [Erwiniaceae bacterium]|nr:DNA (cytosine-5-)-methyltransferase [Erwiniaceae bacterium]